MDEQGENQSVEVVSQHPAQSSPNSPSRKRKIDGSLYVDCKTDKLKSVVWDHMDRVKSRDGNLWAIRKACRKKLKAPYANGTRHLHDHIYKFCPKRKNQEIKQQFLQVEKRKKDGQVEFRNFVFDQDKSREDLAAMIIMHEYPLSIVSHVGFKRFVNSLQPFFKMVSRSTIRRDILKLYDNEKSKQIRMLEELQSRVAITSDMWSSKSSKRGFMVVTAHFLDEEWVLQSRILRFMYVPAPHKMDILCDVILECLLDWNLEKKLSTITLDNCSTNVGMVSTLAEKLDSNSLLVYGEFLHMRCCAHILNLIVQDGLTVIKDSSLKVIRDSVLFWSGTPSRCEKFEESARHLKVPCTKKLCLDVKTQWNSTFLMLQTAIIYKDVFSRLRQREKLYTTSPSEKEWELAKEICDDLKLFYDVTEMFSGTKYPTANIYFPKVCEIKLHLLKLVVSRKQVVREMAKKMMDKYNKYWNVINVIMGIAIVLDPRYKIHIVEFYFKQIYGDEVGHALDRVRLTCYNLLNEYQRKMGLDESNEFRANLSSLEVSGDDPLSSFDIFLQSKSYGQVCTKSTELDLYLEEKVLPRTPNFDVLCWWKTNGIKYPTLRLIARDILAIPVSTVASESAFSTSGRVLSPHRSRLHPTTLEALICTQNWLSKDVEGPFSSLNSESFARIFDEEYDEDE